MEDQSCDPNEILGFRNIFEKYHEVINDKSSVTVFNGKTKDSKVVNASSIEKGKEVKVEKLGDKTNIYVQG